MAWQIKDGKAQPAKYVTGEGKWESFEKNIMNLARREGSRRAKEMVCLADGAHSIWLMLTRCYPDAFQLVDWYHVQDHLAEVATALGAKGEPWHKTQRDLLKEKGPVPVLWELRRLIRTGETNAIRDKAKSCYKYLWWHRTRLDYPTAIERGYPIGSGRIESGCKQVVQQRAKLAGMRWSHDHLQLVLSARCAFLSGDWDMASRQYKRAA